MQKIILILIRAYQYAISPLFGSHCRFYPSCSCYTHDAIQQHGIVKGTWLGMRRLGKCHPWHEGGYDPVPNNTNKN